MPTSAPFDPVQPSSDDGVPTADAPEQTGEESPATPPADTSSRSPDPASLGPEPTGDPVDPAVATNTPDPGQTGRDRR